MRKEMFEISVFTEDGAIVIDGRPPGGDEESYGRVSLRPEQVDAVVAWLKEAQLELLGQ